MDRRRFVLSSVTGIVGTALSRAVSAAVQAAGQGSANDSGEELFPAGNLPDLAWTQFRASGFTEPVCGMIHRKSRPAECGMPLGAVGTGCLDLDTDGTLGYCSIFSSFVPPRGKLQSPLLGIAVNKQTWVLATRHTEEIENVGKAHDIHYWGHYPIADLEYETAAPVSVGLRAWTPFIPGDVAVSNTPGAVFEVRLRNSSRSRQKGTLIFSFPGPTQAEAQISPESPREKVSYSWFTALVPVAQGATPARRQPLRGELSGVTVSSDQGVGYTLAALGGEQVRVASPLGVAGATWFSVGRALEPPENDFGTSLTVDFDLDSKATKVVRFVLAWYAPLWKGEGDHHFAHMYATRYRSSLEVAQLLARNHELLLKRIIKWQQAIYTYDNLPIWLRETLVNNLHLITEVGLWAAAKPSIGNWCRQEDGLFAMNESPRESPQMECLPCSFYGNIPLVYFFPELALSTLRGYKAYQYPDGAAPWIFGGWTGVPPTEGTEMAAPDRGYQTTSNGICYIDMVDKYWLRTGRDEILREFYSSVKQNTIFTMNLNPGPDGVISMPKGNIDPATGKHATEWVENEGWYGMTSHVGGLHLAQLKMAERMAERVGDKEFAAQCRKWFQQGSESMENKMWAGQYYLACFEPATGKRSDVIFSGQLDGDWIDLFHGLPPVFRPERAKPTLATVRGKNSRLSPYGTVFFADSDGTPTWKQAERSGWFGYFVAEQLMLAMTYMYAGEMDFGLEEAHRCMYNLMHKGYTWNQPCVIEAATGERLGGYDYYQNMMLWSMLAAVERKDLCGPCAPGGLVDRVIRAGKGV
jgi:uncharacterized protein (DUF608 family)